MARSTIKAEVKRSASEADRALAHRIGERIRVARHRAGLTQQQLAGDRYTKAYVSALENGIARPSMVALEYLSTRLGVPSTALLDPPAVTGWDRLAADVNLASGNWTEALDGYDAVLKRAIDPLGRADAQRARAEALIRLSRWREAMDAATEAADTFAARGRAVDAALAQYWQAAATDGSGAVAQAEEILVRLERAMESGLDLGDDFRVRILLARAATQIRRGNHLDAVAVLERARHHAAGMDDRRRAAYLYGMATSYRQSGDMEGAIRVATEARALLEAAGAARELVRCENMLAVTFLALGYANRAAEHVAAARTGPAGEDPWIWAHVADTAAQVAIAQGNPDDARRLLAESLEAAGSSGNRLAEADALLTLGQLETAEGNGEKADAVLERGVAVLRDLGLVGRLRDALSLWSKIAADRGDLRRALELAQEALGLG